MAAISVMDNIPLGEGWPVDRAGYRGRVNKVNSTARSTSCSLRDVTMARKIPGYNLGYYPTLIPQSGRMVQWLVHWISNPGVAGSIPRLALKNINSLSDET